jgi:hypothetical protein
MTSTRLAIALVALAVASMALTGCGITEFEDSFDTKFTVPKPLSLESGPYLKTKRFKFENNPKDAEFAKFKKAYVQVVAPEGSDLTFMDSIKVYADLDGELTLLATANEFESGQRHRNLKIELKGDLRGYVVDRRITLVFEVVPSRWHILSWPEDGITVRAGVTMLIGADLI